MSKAYKFKDQTKPYFVTFTVVNWIDLFTRKEYCNILLNSFEYCQKEKGLIIYAWVIMSSHVHMIIGTKDKDMQDVLRDLKKLYIKKNKRRNKKSPARKQKRMADLDV